MICIAYSFIETRSLFNKGTMLGVLKHHIISFLLYNRFSKRNYIFKKCLEVTFEACPCNPMEELNDLLKPIICPAYDLVCSPTLTQERTQEIVKHFYVIFVSDNQTSNIQYIVAYDIYIKQYELFWKIIIKLLS